MRDSRLGIGKTQGSAREARREVRRPRGGDTMASDMARVDDRSLMVSEIAVSFRLGGKGWGIARAWPGLRKLRSGRPFCHHVDLNCVHLHELESHCDVFVRIDAPLQKSVRLVRPTGGGRNPRHTGGAVGILPAGGWL